ncbi:MAG TPA: L-threonylcarbamoyladenylate synthase [Flavobacteriaceae bacterium]|nr:L-threonylcarbamoyladenylate synthase [Flavobacteriaceae bacterium]
MKKEVDNALKILQEGGLLLYPTDTVWGIGCDATNPQAVKNLYALKKRDESKAMVCLVSDFEMVKQYVGETPENIQDVLKKQHRPTTVIYNNPKNVAKNLLANNDTVAIRICDSTFCRKLIKAFGKPIVSTSANISGENSPKTFSQITEEIKKGVDYVVNLQLEAVNIKPSMIIKPEINGEIKIIRA